MVITESHVFMQKTTWVCRENAVSLFAYDDLIFLLDIKGR